MQKIEAFAQAAGLLGAQLRRGVVTNSFLTAADCDREAKTGLYVYEADGELLVFRDRGTHYILNFFLQQGARPTLPDVSKPVVTELAYRPKDADAMLSAAAYFRADRLRGSAPAHPQDTQRSVCGRSAGLAAGRQRIAQRGVCGSGSGGSCRHGLPEAGIFNVHRLSSHGGHFARSPRRRTDFMCPR